MRVNTSVISLYWNIGKKLSEEVLQGKKAEYGKNIIGDLSERLTAEYGKGFEKSSVFKMVKFYQEFSEYEKVATLSQQLLMRGNSWNKGNNIIRGSGDAVQLYKRIL